VVGRLDKALADFGTGEAENAKNDTDAVVTWRSSRRNMLSPRHDANRNLDLAVRPLLHPAMLACLVMKIIYKCMPPGPMHKDSLGLLLRLPHKKYSFLLPLEGGTCLSSSLTALNSLKFGFISSPISHTDAMFPHL
jgi:hypothetical protein